MDATSESLVRVSTRAHWGNALFHAWNTCPERVNYSPRRRWRLVAAAAARGQPHALVGEAVPERDEDAVQVEAGGSPAAAPWPDSRGGRVGAQA